jgi:hypothetical protein
MVLATSEIRWELIPFKFINLDLMFELYYLGLPEVDEIDLTEEQWEALLAARA